MYDLIIVGGGPAGLTAGLYSTRGGLKNVLLLEGKGLGGQITSSSEVENYPGVEKVVTGLELMEPWPKQCSKFGLQQQTKAVKTITQNSDNSFNIVLEDNSVLEAISVIVATGSNPRKAGFKGEEEFFGKGVSTCATCDGFFYRNREVAVLGGGDTALEEALYLANIATKVYLIHRRDSFRASPSTVERVEANEKIEIILNSSVEEVKGDNMGVNAVVLKDKDGSERVLDVPGIFTFVGYDVNNSVLKDEEDNSLCALSDSGEIIVDLNMNTSIDGLFAAGDVRINAPKQVVCAASDGAISATQAIHYVEKFKG
jgi:thioredoxin reductase (NADPH)